MKTYGFKIKNQDIGWILSMFLLFTGCTEDFLDEQLKGEFSSETFYQNDKQALQALTGVYQAISFSTFNNALWVFGDVASDDATKGGNPGDQAEITYIDEFRADRNNGIINNYWTFAYEAISRANNVIAKVPAVKMDENLKQRILGEAKFIRAYMYFNLVNIFGKVPLKLLPQNSPDAIHVPLSDESKIYQQIEQDLLEAAAVLPVSYGSADVGRATRGAALGMLGKVALYQEQWAKAIDYFHQLEALGIYKLEENYAQVFTLAGENDAESIFEIQHKANQIPFIGSCLNQWFAPAIEGGYYFNAPTQSLVDEYEKAPDDTPDPRLDLTIGRDGHPWISGQIFQPTWSPTGYLTKKHQQPLTEVPIATKGDGDLNYKYLRYADVLLMKAEAFNELGQADSALQNLNKVRHRARNSFNGTPPAGLLPDIILTQKDALRKAIMHERRVELAMEFHRYFDLMRWGKVVAEECLGEGFSYEKNRYQPIPQNEIDANNAINP